MKLTKREIEILQLAHLSSNDICEKLCIAPGTLKTHITNLSFKFPNCNGKASYQIEALKSGLIELDDIFNEAKMKYNYNYNENDYKTPPEIYKEALEYLKIDKFSLDTCCSDKNIPADFYYIYGKNNGLTEAWRDYSWCNPPFNEASKWVIKAYNESKNGNRIVMLLPARTETHYWQKYILYNSNVKIKFLRKGPRFLDKNNQPMGVFKNALALVYFNVIN